MKGFRLVKQMEKLWSRSGGGVETSEGCAKDGR